MPLSRPAAHQKHDPLAVHRHSKLCTWTCKHVTCQIACWPLQLSLLPQQPPHACADCPGFQGSKAGCCLPPSMLLLLACYPCLEGESPFFQGHALLK
ncbi:hypothetical protein HaLaN_02174 [Haematococcus lacustris]|uniref:Uncharacterized protein n=1 Tax=Haematococcus lacustris TaxID=44745 RepID=A0A699YKF9_HAELA|nr:hypothetical protein HaLaN_02174 [Haematococcus lacustris]